MRASPVTRDGTVAVVPLRDPGAGKTRLAPLLDRRGRALLARAMVADVVAALRRAPIDRIVVAAAGEGAASVAASLGLDAVRDPRPGGLDRALAAACARLHAATAVVVAADLPCLRAADVAHLLAADTDVAVAPTVDGGTGGLLRRPPDVIPTAYGPASARAHLRLALQAGVSASTRHLAGFAHDVDTAADVRGLVPGEVGAATRQALEALRKHLSVPRAAEPPRP